MIDNSREFRVKRGFGISMMLILLTFAAIPTVWVLILSFRAPLALSLIHI